MELENITWSEQRPPKDKCCVCSLVCASHYLKCEFMCQCGKVDIRKLERGLWGGGQKILQVRDTGRVMAYIDFKSGMAHTGNGME